MGRSDRSVTWARACALLFSSVLVLAACGGPPAEPTVTVEGRVEAALGLPMAGVLVRSQGNVTTTAADGSFTLADLTSPYTVSLSSDAPDPWMHVFEGLTTTAPTLVPHAGYFLPLAQPTAYQRTEVSGSLPDVVPAGTRMVVCVEGLAHDVFGCDTVEEGGNSYAFEATWAVAGDVEVRLHALLVRGDVDGRPIAYESYGTVDLTLTPGVPAVQVAPGGPGLATVDLNGTVAAAGGGTLAGTIVSVRVGPRLAMRVYVGAPAGGALELFRVPEFAADDCHVFAIAEFAAGRAFAWQVGAAADGFAVVMPAPTQLLEPPDGVTDVTTETVFGAVGGPGGARTFRWYPEVGQVGPQVLLSTASGSVTMPDPADVGLPLPAAGAYRWSVIGTAVVDADGLALPNYAEVLNYINFFLEGGGPGFSSDGTYVMRDPRSFTLAP